MSGIPLAMMLADLRSELAEAADAGKDQDLVFEMQDIELELQMSTTHKDGRKGGVKFWVFNAEGSGESSVAGGHTLKLKMRVLDRATGAKTQINSPSTDMP